MTGTGQPPAVALRRMTTAYWTSQVVYVTTQLGIPDILTNGPQTSEALAAQLAPMRPRCTACCAPSRVSASSKRMRDGGSP
jgi:hypothetical protein